MTGSLQYDSSESPGARLPEQDTQHGGTMEVVTLRDTGTVRGDTEQGALMAECDAMEREFAAWLERATEMLALRALRRVPNRELLLRAPLARTLLLVWCTSPAPRKIYSDEARQGFLAAAETMDDATLLSLVRGLLAHRTPPHHTARPAA
jgi:hypothetical protein